MSFLDELKQQAQARQAQLRDDHAMLERNAALVEAACAEVWRYLDDLGRQLDVLRPTSPARYAIDARVVLEGLRYGDFFADVRRKRVMRGPLASPEWVDHLVLTAHLRADQHFELTKDFPPEIDKLEARLTQAGIRCLGEPERDPVSGHFLANHYRFDADLVAGVRVLPQHDLGQLQFVVQNLDGLATIQATFAAQQMSTERLDELAKWWVGQPHRFLEGALAVQRIEPA